MARLKKGLSPFVLDTERAAAALREAMHVIAPDGRVPLDFDEQMEAAYERAMARGDIDDKGLTEKGRKNLQDMFGIRRQ